MDGRIPTGTTLPSERSLAEATGLSRTTTTRAYEVLRESRSRPHAAGLGHHGGAPDRRRGFDQHARAAPAVTTGSPSTAAASEAPEGFSALIQRAMTSLPTLLATDGYLPDGLPVLRERLAARYTRHGLPTDPDQIVVTTGAQSALSLLVSVLVRPRRPGAGGGLRIPPLVRPRVAGRRAAAAAPGRRGLPWPVEEVARLAPAASLALLVVDFHNPTGALMPSDTRREVAGILQRAGRHDDRRRDPARRERLGATALPEHYAVHDPAAVLVGSAAKSLWGGLRIGWIRAPRSSGPPARAGPADPRPRHGGAGPARHGHGAGGRRPRPPGPDVRAAAPPRHTAVGAGAAAAGLVVHPPRRWPHLLGHPAGADRARPSSPSPRTRA